MDKSQQKVIRSTRLITIEGFEEDVINTLKWSLGVGTHQKGSLTITIMSVVSPDKDEEEKVDIIGVGLKGAPSKVMAKDVLRGYAEALLEVIKLKNQGEDKQYLFYIAVKGKVGEEIRKEKQE